MKKLKLFALIALLTSFTAYATLTEYTYTTKYGYTGDTRVIEWCQPDRENFPNMVWDVEIRSFEGNQIVQLFTELGDTSVEWTPPRTGHYTFRVRNRVGDYTSNWIESTASTGLDETCGPAQSGWWLFAWIKPVGDVIILP